MAVTSDAYATYWNPAGLAMSKTVDIRVGFSFQGIDRIGMNDTLKEIDKVDLNDASAGNQARLQSLIDKINRPGASVSAIGAGGLYIKGYYGDHAFGISVADVATAGMFAPTRLTVANTGTLSVNGQLALQGLEARQATFSYAYAFLDRTLSIGVTGKLIQGAAYNGTATVTDGEIDVSDKLGKAKLSTAFGIDVGAVYRPSSWLRVGIVAKDINAPSFDTKTAGQQFKLEPQVRGGIAVNPWDSLTVTADMDVTSNRTLTPGIKSQVLSVGAEQTVFSEMFAFRVGAFKNTADANSFITPTAGIGIRLFALRVDVGGGYDFRERGALASGTVAMTF
ncbi:MAG: conjugal transfer protein TraF [Nitrospira sp.]|nr:conjugal transfer protein TraF [Nitrospira sp.]